MTPSLSAPDFEALVHAHHAEVYRSARRIVANDADALDVTQQVFLRVLEGKVSLEPARDRGAWLRWLAARTALSHLRASGTRKEKEEQAVVERIQERVDDEATWKEARLALQRHLARLPDELRAAIVLRFQEGWTFAQIASEQDCSEPSAHDRVQRGLERLRGELSRAGFAGIAVVLPQELALDPAAASALPPGLEHRLLGLRTSAALSAASKLVAGAVALVCVVAVAAAAVWMPASPGPAREVAALGAPLETSGTRVDEPPATGGRAPQPLAGEDRREQLPPAPPPPPRPADAGRQLAPGILSGRCLDEHGAPIAQVSVFASSVQHDGKFARFTESASTGIDGRFVVSVPVSIESGQEYVLTTRHLDFVPHTREKALARAGQTTELGELALMHSSHDAAGDSTLDVLVLDAAGAPLRHTIVTVLRSVKDAGGELHEETEATARTDAAGRVSLGLKRLGTKRLHVLPPAGELGPASLALGIDAPGRFARTVQLERGLTISGQLFSLGGRLVHGNGGFLAAYAGNQSPWIQAEIDDNSGNFVLRGLEDRPYTLVHDGDEWSRVQLEGVRAGTSGLVIQLKLQSDTRDIGDHQAELHGEVRDAKTGEVLLLGPFTVRVEYLGDLRGLDWQRDVLPTLVFPRPVQTMLDGNYVPPPAFHIEGLAAGNYAVAARIPGYAPAFAGPFVLGKSEMRSGIVIEVERPAILQGVLTDPAGRPLAGGFARVTGLGEAAQARDQRIDESLRTTRGRGAIDVWDEIGTDEQGRFTFEALPAWSSVRLALHHPDFKMAYSSELVLHAGETTDVGKIAVGVR